MYDAILGKFSCTSCDHKVNTTVRGRSIHRILRDTGVADDRPGWKTTGMYNILTASPSIFCHISLTQLLQWLS